MLKCLYGISSATKKGKVYVNHEHRRAAFILQNEYEHLLENLTVEESIVYARRIKNKMNGFATQSDDSSSQVRKDAKAVRGESME